MKNSGNVRGNPVNKGLKMLTRQFQVVTLLHFSVMLLVGCTDDFTAAPNSARTQNSDVWRIAPDDKSLSPEEYLQKGIPAPDRPWSGVELMKVANIFTAMAQRDAGDLPRYESARSGTVFSRLTDRQNLELYRNLSLPLEQRMPVAMSHQEATNALTKIYLGAYNQRKSGTDELVELLGSQLRVCVVMLELMQEFLPTLDKQDPSYPVRMEGVEAMKGGLASVVAGALVTLTERDAYKVPELKRMISHLRETLPGILPHVSDANRTETLVRLRSFKDDAAMQALNPELGELLSEVEAVLKPEATP
jgi:hypothetical protein